MNPRSDLLKSSQENSIGSDPDFDPGRSSGAEREMSVYRRLILIAGGVYAIWWFAVEWLLPQARNPGLGRFFVCLSIFVFWAMSFRITFVRKHLKALFTLSVWLITAHYYYLFYLNGGDLNWIVGCFITVVAVSLGLLSTRSLLTYSGFVMGLSLLLWWKLDSLHHSVFLLGLTTILFQANMGLHSRLALIRNLALSKARFQQLFHGTFEGVLVHLDGQILDANEALAKMFQCPISDLVGKNILDLVDPSVRDAVASRVGSSEPRPFETVGRTQNGKQLHIEVRGKDFQFDHQKARLVTVQDISDRKRAERERISAHALAENLRVRDEFITLLSHELKTPLSSLKLQSEILAQDAREGLVQGYRPEEIQEMVSLLDRQVDRLTELIENMLDVSRISTGRLLVESQEVDLAQLIRESAEALPKTEGSISAIELDLPFTAPIQGDRRRLRQMLDHLLGNALKYGAQKPVRVSLRMEGREACLEIQDQGIGIGPEYLARIFDRFERAVSSQNISGLGLGLYLVRQIAEAHGGLIQVKSQLGVGSTFRVRLPSQRTEREISAWTAGRDSSP